MGSRDVDDVEEDLGMSAWPAWLPGPAWSAWSLVCCRFLQGWKKVNVALYCSIFVFECTLNALSSCKPCIYMFYYCCPSVTISSTHMLYPSDNCHQSKCAFPVSWHIVV